MHVSVKVHLITHTRAHIYITHWTTRGIKYCVITKDFYIWVAGEAMIPLSNYNTKDIARY
jgi:hypothetical protein